MAAPERSITDYMSAPEYYEVIADGNTQRYAAGEQFYYEIKHALSAMNEGGHEVPALGVALDGEVKEELKRGVYLRMKYARKLTHGGMNFDELLIAVRGEYTGYNIIRGTDGKYGGRCYYVNLENNMSPLAELLAANL